MSALTDLLSPLIRERDLVALTGGASNNLDGIATVGLALSPVPYLNFVIADVRYSYFLRAGTDAESSPSIIRPDDYAGTTNEKVWERLSAGVGDMIGANNLSEVASPSTARTNIGAAAASDLATLTGTVSSLSGTVSSQGGDITTLQGDVAGKLAIANDLADLNDPNNARTNLGLAIGADVQAWNANLDAWAAEAPSNYLTTHNNLADLTDAGDARANLGLVPGTDVQAWSANLDLWAAEDPADFQSDLGYTPLNAASNLSDLANAVTARDNLGLELDVDVPSQSVFSSTISGLGVAIVARLVIASNLSDLANAGTARTNLGVAIGSNVQAWNANLDAWALLSTSAKLTTSSNLSDLANAGTARTNLGVAIGSNVQAWSANLDSWSALATSAKLTTASNLSDLPNAATARTNLGLAIGTDVPSQAAVTNLKKTRVNFVIDGGGVAITTGSKGCLSVPAAMTITGWEIFGDVSGSIVVDIKRATYANLPTFTAISASAQPTLSSAQKNVDSTVTGWTTSIADGDYLEFNVASATTVTRVTVVIIGTTT